MKNYILLFLLSFVFMRVSTQELSQEISLPRAGDILDKTQLDYTTSGASGEEVIWDFRKQTVRDDNYKVSYSGKIDSILCLSESRTQYKYSFQEIRYFLSVMKMPISVSKISFRQLLYVTLLFMVILSGLTFMARVVIAILWEFLLMDLLLP